MSGDTVVSMPGMRQTARVSPTRRVDQLTQNDAKILGSITTKRAEKSAPANKFQTRKFKTLTSAWTPLVHKPSNENIFKERRDLVCNWFDLWTDSQRKRFLDMLFHHCRKSQLYFIQKWFKEKVPMKHLDFTKVLPRFLSLYIFSFLDPRSMSRAAMVCWHWKFVADQDVLWQPKCTRRTWYLPYTPADNEYGAWKKHYIACTQTMDMDVVSQNKSDMYGSLGDGSRSARKGKIKSARISLNESREVLHARPPWQPTDKTPRDTEIAAKALMADLDPNDPKTHESLTLHHNKFGISKTALRRSCPGGLVEFGLHQSGRNGQHRILDDDDDPDLRPPQTARHKLSESIVLESYEEQRMMELVRQPWEPPLPQKSPSGYRSNLAGGADYPLSWKNKPKQQVSKSFPHKENPRVIFISSRIPAADMLVDAVLFGIIPIVYEFEGTTLASLISQLDQYLEGRSAKSIGMFVHSHLPWELKLVHGSTVSVENLDLPEFVEFFETLANFVPPPSQGGHVDIFAPVGSCEPGMEMLIQLQTLTGMTFTAPTGVVGNYNHVNSDWLDSPEGKQPPGQYFCQSKLNVWSNMADQAKEACRVTKSLMSRYFEQKHRDVVSQLVGQMVFDVTAQVDVQGVNNVSGPLVDGLLKLGQEQNKKKTDDGTEDDVRNPLEFLGHYLLERAGGGITQNVLKQNQRSKPLGGTLAPGATLSARTLSDQLELNEEFDDSLPNSEHCDDDADGEVANINKRSPKKVRHEDVDIDDISEELDGDEIPEEIGQIKTPRKQTKKFAVPKPHFSTKSPRTRRGDTSLLGSGEWSNSQSSFCTKMPNPLTDEQLRDHPERRTPIAREILSSEIEYMRTLEIFEKVFVLPLRSALESNRGILSAHNIQMIFSDPISLLQMSRGLVKDLKSRLSDWNPQQCLGDIFVKFSGHFKTYTNFLKNYPTILLTIERSCEQSPLFRAYLKRHERSPQTKMLCLSELMLLPARRIGEYVRLLTWFQTHTASDHADRSDLKLAIRSFGKLDDFISSCKKRAENERELTALQKKIINCPVLLEANRFLVRHLDIAHLKPPTDSIKPELRCYQHIETLGLFLFNDSLVITRRVIVHFPYERSSDRTYKFDVCVALNRLRVEEIPDSKYVRNAFRIYTPRRSWVCQTDSREDKFNFTTLLDNTIRAYFDSME